MNKGIQLVMILILASSCRDSIRFDPKMAASSFVPSAGYIIELTDELSAIDCLFQELDLELKDYQLISKSTTLIKDDQEQKVILVLKNKDSIVVHKKGCDYFSYDISWNLKNETHPIEDLDYWLSKTNWLMENLFQLSDQAAFKNNIAEKNYHYTIDKEFLHLIFTNHNYQEWYLKIKHRSNHEITLTTGYYYN